MYVLFYKTYIILRNAFIIVLNLLTWGIGVVNKVVAVEDIVEFSIVDDNNICNVCLFNRRFIF